MVALDKDHYNKIVRTSTIETGNYQVRKAKLNLPSTEQAKFNRELNKIADKYAEVHPELAKALRYYTCSEPLPCPVYCLPKDHKEGELKGRPIHAATDTPATRLSKYLASQLKVLLVHVPAHLKNTNDFITFLSTIDQQIHGFCSLDVCNLYGSIPVDDLEDGTPGVLTVIQEFFSNHKRDSDLRFLDDSDFVSLVRLCLTSDVVLIDNRSFQQESGLAMGNNLAPTLAIIYMNKLDAGILSSFNDGALSLKRYIDDMFVIWHSDLDPNFILSTANSLNKAIQFTMEQPTNDSIPFLDTMVTLNRDTNKFTTRLYVKPIHSECITPWDSHGPISAKRGLLIGEIKRAISRSTDSR